jgi:thiamine-phosphate pyrophosphorylase
MPVHDEDELVKACLEKADAGFLSPVFATESHPSARPLGRMRAVALAQASRLPLFALGGMDPASAATLEGAPFQGFGAIGAFTAHGAKPLG